MQKRFFPFLPLLIALGWAAPLIAADPPKGTEPTNAAEAAAKKSAEDAEADAKYQAFVAKLPPAQQAWERTLQENLGTWFPSYVRVGNFRMAMGHPRIGQKWAAEWLVKSINEDKLRAVFLTRFPSMNHCVIVYRAIPRPNGDVGFLCYDPNYEGQSAKLDYSASRRSFDFQRRWYFPGGQVNVMRVYISPFH